MDKQRGSQMERILFRWIENLEVEDEGKEFGKVTIVWSWAVMGLVGENGPGEGVGSVGGPWEVLGLVFNWEDGPK